MKDGRISGIYAIMPEDGHTASLLEKVTAALAGGVRLFQYRNKSGSGKLRREQCKAVLGAVRTFDGTLIVNDDYRLALDVGAEGVHLGVDDGSIENARRVLGPEAIIGVSCYASLDRATDLQGAGVDYVAFGSFFPSLTKPDAVHAPIELLSSAKSRLSVPVVAIGGINKNNARLLTGSGADAVAVLSSLFAADDVAQQARELVSVIKEQDV